MTEPTKTNQGFTLLGELHQVAKKENTNVVDSSNSRVFSEKSIIDIINDIAYTANCTLETAYKGTIAVLNQGGTSPRAQRSIFVKIESQRISLDMIKKSLQKIEGNKATTRKLARSFGTKAYEISKDLKIKGNLANKLLELNPELSKDDLYWAADFQESNTECPKKVKELLRKYYNDNVKKKKDF